MRSWLKILIPLGVLVGLVVAGYGPAIRYLNARGRPHYRTADVSQGDLSLEVNTTGVVKPVLSVEVGSFVSGPILALYADFNEKVMQNQLLAKVDPRLYAANVDRDQATLATRLADVERAEALLQQAKNNESRALALRKEGEDYISDQELDQFIFNRKSLEAQLDVARAAVRQADASLANSKANLEYTNILAPVDGLVIDRKIDEGQTLAAQFQTPQLFIVAPDLEQEVYIHASIDEAEIGLIQDAKERDQPVEFTVDAHPERLFHGSIRQIRLSSTTTQNVVTYPVVVSAANGDQLLLPGMTANLSFKIEERNDVLRVPNSALRFYPPDSKWVREGDRPLLEGGTSTPGEPANNVSTASEKTAQARERNRRHVWIQEGEFLRAVEVTTGLSDHRFTEIVAGDLKAGQKLVIGVSTGKPPT
ncbi:MAG: efflux RND transporter periplasmic adaptor subunit [Planctomycetes bacterium]|nr:efflux RND transporter periplasmic adaptor subunit [Planctomycetota bacterium]